MNQHQIDTVADALEDYLCQLGVDGNERPEHGGITTGQVLARVAIKAYEGALNSGVALTQEPDNGLGPAPVFPPSGEVASGKHRPSRLPEQKELPEWEWKMEWCRINGLACADATFWQWAKDAWLAHQQEPAAPGEKDNSWQQDANDQDFENSLFGLPQAEKDRLRAERNKPEPYRVGQPHPSIEALMKRDAPFQGETPKD